MRFSRGLLFAIVAGAAAAQPTVYFTGVMNAASPTYQFDGSPQEIARGGMFVITGKDLGPLEARKASDTSSTELAGTSVRIVAADTLRDAAVVYTSFGMVAGIVPADLPLGDASFTVSYNG